MICHDVVLYVVASKGIKFVALAERLLLLSFPGVISGSRISGGFGELYRG